MPARISQSQFALLGLLNLGPMSGYDLRQLIAWSVGHFWNEGYGQIYPTLKKLAAEGLVERATEQKQGKPDRHVYSLTEAGVNDCGRGCGESPQPAVPRNELLLKVFFGGLVPMEITREHIEEHRRLHAALLETFEGIRQRIAAETGNHPDQPFWRMTLRHGELVSGAIVAWCEETLAELNARKRPGLNAEKSRSKAKPAVGATGASRESLKHRARGRHFEQEEREGACGIHCGFRHCCGYILRLVAWRL